jgi:hypothetical protein
VNESKAKAWRGGALALAGALLLAIGLALAYLPQLFTLACERQNVVAMRLILRLKPDLAAGGPDDELFIRAGGRRSSAAIGSNFATTVMEGSVESVKCLFEHGRLREQDYANAARHFAEGGKLDALRAVEPFFPRFVWKDVKLEPHSRGQATLIIWWHQGVYGVGPNDHLNAPGAARGGVAP